MLRNINSPIKVWLEANYDLALRKKYARYFRGMKFILFGSFIRVPDG